MTVPLAGDRIVSEPLEHAPGTGGTAAYAVTLHHGPGAAADGSPAVAANWCATFNTAAHPGEPVDVSGFCGGSAFEY
jgi:hypothetical protein